LIGIEYRQLLARCNRWMNERMRAAASATADEARKRGRAAFFGSLHRTRPAAAWA